MQNGVTFDNRHSYWDWGLLTQSIPIVSPPVPKEKLIEVPGTDAVIDLTEATGQVHYKQRTIACSFVLMGDPAKQNEVYTDILNHLQGKRLNIVLDSDPEYIYTGRAKITGWEPGQFAASLAITATVEPYKTARYIQGKKVL